MAEAQRAQAAFAVFLHVVGEHRVGQHRNMAKHVVKNVRLLQVIEVLRGADEIPGRETAVGQMVEKHIFRHQARHGNNLPAGEPEQGFRKPAKIGNALPAQIQRLEAAQIGVAGAARQDGRLAVVKRDPGGVFFSRVSLPPLRNGPIGGMRCVHHVGPNWRKGSGGTVPVHPALCLT